MLNPFELNAEAEKTFPRDFKVPFKNAGIELQQKGFKIGYEKCYNKLQPTITEQKNEIERLKGLYDKELKKYIYEICESKETCERLVNEFKQQNNL